MASNSRRNWGGRTSQVQFLASEIPKIYTSQLKGSRFNYNRQALDPIPVNGRISSWDDNMGYGFVEPEVDLSKIKNFTDKVFLHKNDINYDDVQVGDEVSFLLYSDFKGIGAHLCVRKGEEISRNDETIRKVIPMAIPNKLLGALIGKKGQFINELSDKYEVNLSIHSNPRERQANALQLVTMSGEEEDLKESCKAICDRMTKSSLKSFNSKMLFLIPSDQVGRFIGNKGIHIRKAVEHERDVSLTISKNSIWFKNTEWQKVILFGPADAVQNCIDPVISQMCFLFSNIVDDYVCGRKRVVRKSNRNSYSPRGDRGRRDNRFANRASKEEEFENEQHEGEWDDGQDE